MSRDVLSRPAPAGRVVPYGDLPEQVVEYWDGDGPQVVFIHGGFWRSEYDRAHVRPLCNDLAARGYSVAAIEFRRTAPGVPGWTATFDDVLAALKAVGGDPILAGHSAGGHLALWAASRGASARGVLALAPVADVVAAYRDDLDEGAAVALLGGTPEEFPDRYAEATPGDPGVPTVLIHGDADRQVPISQSRTFGHGRLIELPGVDHFALIDPAPGHSGVWGVVLDALASLA